MNNSRPSPLDYRLYLATDSAFLSPPDNRGFLESIAQCLESGRVTILQFRIKNLAARQLFELGRQVMSIAKQRQIPMIVNDRVDLAMALNADGVHVGRNDLPPAAARRLMPQGIIGYSVNALAHLSEAEKAGVDYIGVGPVFATSTKLDTGPVLGVAGLRAICRHTNLPCIGIGGITIDNAASVIEAGAAGLCVVSAILEANDPGSAARALRQQIDSQLAKTTPPP